MSLALATVKIGHVFSYIQIMKVLNTRVAVPASERFDDAAPDKPLIDLAEPQHGRTDILRES